MRRVKAGKVGRRSGGHMPATDRGTILGLRCSTAWRDWLDGLADHCRLNKVDVIDLAVVAYAHRVGFKAAPPRR